MTNEATVDRTVTEANDLGITTIEIERIHESDARLFRLTGLDASGNEVARFEQRIGEIPDVGAHFPGVDNVGLEQLTTLQGQTSRFLSREIATPTIAPRARVEKVFFNLASVKASLEQENTYVMPERDGGQPGAPEVAFSGTGGCYAGQLNTSPAVAQCCQNDGWYTFGSSSMEFKPTSGANANLLVNRIISPYGYCKSMFGGSCSGTSCYYGPNGFSRPGVYANSTNWTVNSVQAGYADYSSGELQQGYDYYCGYTESGGSVEFPGTQSGTQPTNAGCPGGTSGAGEWDY